jgi:MtN3 and saliva related transmembrane protein
MNMEFLGYAAGFLTTLAFLPQVVKTVRYGSTKDISLGMYVLLCAGIALWIGYGLWLGAIPVVLANGITLVFAGVVLFCKIRNG